MKFSCLKCLRKKGEYKVTTDSGLSGTLRPINEEQNNLHKPSTELDSTRQPSSSNPENEIEEEPQYRRSTSEKSTTENKVNGRETLESIKQVRRAGVPSQPIDSENVEITKVSKDQSAKELIKSALMKNEFLNNIFDSERLQIVADAMYLKKFNAKEYIIKEGDTGSHMYVSAEGNYEVSKENKVLSKFGPGAVFGELAILYNAKRAATIRATSKVKVWVLDRAVFQKIMVRTAIDEQEANVEFLSNIPKLNQARPEVLYRVANLLKKEYFSTDTVIVRQGDHGDKFYIIKVGNVVVKKFKEGSNKEEEVGYLGRGEFFGEQALLHEDTRQATVVAQAPGVECLTLDRNDFIENFGDVEDIANIKFDEDQTELSNEVRQDNKFAHIQFKDLEILETLGVGGFGRVELVRNRHNKQETFALKYLKKVDMVQMHQQTHAYNEKNLMMSCDSEFICKMYKTFKDAKYLYFLMEVCLGGDVWTMMQRRKGFSEKIARFMTACVVEAFAYLHSRNIAYRDLKPENVLVDKDKYIKVVDFGFAKVLKPNTNTYTFAGTPEYVAPEIILNRGHCKAVDYWALGVFVYELLVGKPPFRENDHLKTYNAILKGIDAVQFDAKVPKTAQVLIKKLCRPAPTDRIGCLKNGVNDIRNSKWFMGFDWAELQSRNMKSPIHCSIDSETDTQNFDKYPKDTDIPPDELSGWDNEF